MWIHNSFPTSGQPLSYDKRFASYRIFSKCRIFDDVISINADVSKNNDVIVIFVIVNKRTQVLLLHAMQNPVSIAHVFRF